MTLGIILLVALLFAVFYIKKKITDLHRTFDDKLSLLTKVMHKPAESAMDIGASLAEAAIERVKNVFEKKDRRK